MFIIVKEVYISSVDIDITTKCRLAHSYHLVFRGNMCVFVFTIYTIK